MRRVLRAVSGRVRPGSYALPLSRTGGRERPPRRASGALAEPRCRRAFPHESLSHSNPFVAQHSGKSPLLYSLLRTYPADSPGTAGLGPLPQHAIVTVLVAGTFGRGLGTPIQRSWDDGRFIVDNPLVHEPSWDALFSVFTQAHFEAFHPLHLLSYWLDVPLAGSHPVALHAVSLALWIGSANLLLWAERRLTLSGGAAVVATSVCVLHPVQVEAAVWLSGRKDILALGLSAMCIACYRTSRSPFDHWAWLSRCSYVLACLSKTTALPLPLVLFAADLLLRCAFHGV